MNIILHIVLILITTIIAACSSNIGFDSYSPIHHFETLGNVSKWDSIYFDTDSNLVIPLDEDTFQIHFVIDKNNNNALIFSVGEIDTVGYLSTENQIVYFKPKNHEDKYKMFDFNAKINDSWIIKYCGPLTNHILKIEDAIKERNEIIQTIKVDENSSFPSFNRTEIKRIVVSSKYGIVEMEIHVGWAEQDIKI